MSTELSKNPKEAFVPPSDRPEVKMAPDASPRDWGVRPLPVILGQQLARMYGSEKVQPIGQNSDLMQKCCEKRHPDLCDLMSFPPPGMPGLEIVIEVESRLKQRLTELSQTGSTIVSRNREARR